MRLFRIEHVSCGDYDGYTYLWDLKDRNEEQLEADVLVAQAAYRSAAAAVKPYEGEPWRSWQGPMNAEGYPDNMTIGEVKAQRQADRLAYEEWQKVRQVATRPFGAFMLDLGGYEWLADGEVPTVGLDWGHHHGTRVEQSLNEPGDLPPSTAPKPVVRKEGRTRVMSSVVHVTER